LRISRNSTSPSFLIWANLPPYFAWTKISLTPCICVSGKIISRYFLICRFLLNINLLIYKTIVIYYTGCPKSPGTVKYFINYALWKEMFQTKVVWLEGSHKMVSLVCPWKVIWKSREGHLQFFKQNCLLFIPYSCSSSRELSKTL